MYTNNQFNMIVTDLQAPFVFFSGNPPEALLQAAYLGVFSVRTGWNVMDFHISICYNGCTTTTGGKQQMKKRILGILIFSITAAFLLCACTRSTYSQEDIGQPKEPVTETTIQGRWYFEGHKEAYIDFNEDGTYVTNNEGKMGDGTYELSDDFKTVHLKENTTSIDEDVSVMYGNDILYLIWKSSREQMFTREITDGSQ